MHKLLIILSLSISELPAAFAADLENISTRGFVGTAAQNMHAGFVIEGSKSIQVLVKASGPSLPQELNGLNDPFLTLFNTANGTMIHQNDNWETDPSSSLVRATGRAPTDSREPAFVTTLPPGSYTAVVKGVNGGTGLSVPSITKVNVGNN